MKKQTVLLALLAAALQANVVQAQWFGFIDPNIINEAGRMAAEGDTSLFEDRSLGTVQQSAPAPTAAEVAEEVVRIQNNEKYYVEQKRIEGKQELIRATIAKAYKSEYGTGHP
ncbi:MAG: hypothetical protein U1C47_18060 [Hydrogenophaga sp.]|uniref:hypothetical protein n=1 Tax=Hydrogenophaga sp. TaxID=1904254 RepID=UPI00273318AB|nr:hypothetical protein [Hydrogenophaga sp.]MDP3626134.1 hypothetical protein [Hydrogenophaga sp.]MDZ4293816.1 hypothetical protein [Hydrogenophaga sp.]